MLKTIERYLILKIQVLNIINDTDMTTERLVVTMSLEDGTIHSHLTAETSITSDD